MTIWEIIVALFTAFGGIETVKWLLNRRNNNRISDAQADHEEFVALREYNDFLQKQLTDKEQRFVEQTDRLRETQDALFTARQKCAQLELELALKRCERKKCADRQPQNGY